MLPTQMPPTACYCERPPGLQQQKLLGDPAGREAVVAAAAVDACLAVAAMAGAALLTWWAVAFHPSYAQLWMVPLGLVLACTPPVVCLALRFSGDSRVGVAPGKGGHAHAAAPPRLHAVVVHK